MVTMSQKSSFLQPANSVSQVLIPDISAELFALGHTSKSGKAFTASSVRKMLV
jgi:hypothetical protein